MLVLERLIVISGSDKFQEHPKQMNWTEQKYRDVKHTIHS